MKTYKTWEVIKALTENPKLKFRNSYGVSITTKKPDDSNSYKLLFSGCMFRGILDKDEWELVKEPVSFEEVLLTNKKVIVEHRLLNEHMQYLDYGIKEMIEHQEYTFLNNILYYLAKYFTNENLKSILREGKWYIED